MKRTALVLVAATLIGGVSYYAFSQQAPSELPGCVYNATPPTLADKQSVRIQCDINGQIKVQ